MARILHFILFLVISGTSLGQVNLKDSIALALKKDHSFMVSLNNRTSFVNANRVTTYGLRFVRDYDHMVKLYAGLNAQSNKNKIWLYADDRFAADTVLRSGRLAYISLGIEPTVHRRAKFKVSLPTQFGFGFLNNSYSASSQKIANDYIFLMPVEFGVNTSYQIFPLLSIRAGLGYRLMLGKEEILRLSSPYYSLGLSVPLRPLYDALVN